jgi:hypothetical protein
MLSVKPPAGASLRARSLADNPSLESSPTASTAFRASGEVRVRVELQ